MSDGKKTRSSVPISETAAVNTGEVNVSVEGVDPAGVAGSFSVHLLKDGQRIASRFFFQPSVGAEAMGAADADRRVHFDFVLPIEAVAGGELGVRIEPAEPDASGAPVPLERMGRPTLSVRLMLEQARDDT